MRPLKAKDIAPFTKILARMELKEILKELFGKNKKQNEGEIGTQIIWIIIENYPKAEKELFAFLGELEGKTPEEIAELPLDEFIALIAGLLSEENLPFFKLLAK